MKKLKFTIKDVIDLNNTQKLKEDKLNAQIKELKKEKEKLHLIVSNFTS